MSSKPNNLGLADFLVPVRRAVYIATGFLDRLLNRGAPAVFILCYHSAANNSSRFSMDAAAIKEQISMLCARYIPVALEDVVDFLAGKKTFAAPAFAVTFDDGYASLLTLKNLPAEYGVKPTVFALARPESADREELASMEQFLTTKELQELHRAGWGIGCHGATHRPLTSADETVLASEILQAKKVLEDALGLTVPYFAYPKGEYTQKTLAMVKAAQFKAAFTMDDDIMRPGLNIYALPRIGVDKTHYLREFKCLWSPSVIMLRRLLKKLISF